MEASLRISCDSASLENERRVAEMETLRIHAASRGYDVAADVPADGDCFFHSVAFLLGRPLSESAELRRQLVSFMNSKVCIMQDNIL